MSLLTEEQIKDLSFEISNRWDAKNLWVSFPEFKNYISEWSKKQTGMQVKVNWDLAPKGSMSLDIIGKWRDKNDTFQFF